MEKKYKLLLGDCLDKLKELDDNSIDSIVTDPPYGIGFMGKAWDTFDTKNVNKANEDASKSFDKTKENKQDNPNLKGRKNAPIGGKATFAGTYDLTPKGSLAYQQFCEEWGKECLRVLKPGGHLLSSCSPRMYHRMTVGLEDAGFEIRDQIMWVYGSGFPKSHNIGKAIDKIEGTSQYEGWGTALKPAHEPIVMARKPFKGNVAGNVLEWGTGGINIDDCRIPFDTDDRFDIRRYNEYHDTFSSYEDRGSAEGKYEVNEPNTQGRFPANLILDKEAGKVLDLQSGTTKSSKRGAHNNKKTEHTNTYTPPQAMYSDENTYGDSGGASRFFYCPKTSKKDRNEGVEYKGQVLKGRDEGQDKMSGPFKLRPAIGDNPNKPTQPRSNIHPTVKPTDLMAYLIRLVTPKDGIVLDPFMGSGSTGKAAMREGFGFVGIERDEEYMEIAKSRIECEHNKRKFF